MVDYFLLFLLSLRAVDLAERHDFPQIEALLVRHTGQLLNKGDPLQAVEVFRMAGKATDAALLLAKLAEDAGKRLIRMNREIPGMHLTVQPIVFFPFF